MSALLCCLWLAVFQADAPPDPAKLLDLLRQRDAAFDNACLQYFRTDKHIQKPDLHSFDQGAIPLRPVGKEYWLKYRVSLIAKQAEVTVISEPLGEIPPIALENPIRCQKWSNAEGQWREVVYMKNSTDQLSANFVTKEVDKAYDSLLREDRMYKEFSFGIGYGKRITKIDKITPHPVGWVLEGSIKIWTDDDSRFRLVLDKEYIVREAEIDVLMGKMQPYKITVKTTGTATTKDLALAQTGHFRRYYPAVLVDGKVQRAEIVRGDEQYEFIAYQPRLSAEEYRKFISFDIPNNSYIWDHVKGEKQFKDAEGKVHFVERLKPAKP